MTLKEVYDILYGNGKLQISGSVMERVSRCHDFLSDYARDKVIYGINTGFGPMAQWRVSDEHLRELQYNIIRSHSTGAGEPLSDTDVRAAMLARIGTFLQARSGIHPEVVELLQEFVNRDIYPFVPRHGSVGASGDLVQLAHIALCLIGEGEVHYKGEWRATAEVLAEEGLSPIGIHVREGLSTCNGTSVMTGIMAVNLHEASRQIASSIECSAWLNEVAESYSDYMSEALNECRRQAGQQIVAETLRSCSEGSGLLQEREDVLYNSELNGADYFEHKVQAYYSLRCVPQIIGPVVDTLLEAARITEQELNSACDNPVVDYERGIVVHGGNFHGDYISLEADKVKIGMTRIAMLAERQLNYLFHDRINGLMPPFLNMGTLGLNYGLQACQFTATSTTAECQTLSMPNYVHSIPNNNDNQDIVSMGTNSALLCRQVTDNVWQVLSILYMALAQATDVRGIADKLSPHALKLYEEVRRLTPARKDDKPFYEDLKALESWLRTRHTDTILTRKEED